MSLGKGEVPGKLREGMDRYGGDERIQPEATNWCLILCVAVDKLLKGLLCNNF